MTEKTADTHEAAGAPNVSKGEKVSAFDRALLLERFDEAGRLLEELKSIQGESALYLYRLGLLKQKKGERKEAYDIFKSLYFEAPVFMRDKDNYQELKTEMITNQLEKSHALRDEAKIRMNAFIKENPEAADRHGKEPFVKEFWKTYRTSVEELAASFALVLGIEPYDKDALQGLIECYSELENNERKAGYVDIMALANKYWKDLISNRSESILTAATKNYEQGHFDLAVSTINLALDTDPLYPPLLLLKAESLTKLGEFNNALRCVHALLKLGGEQGKALRLKKVIESRIFDTNLEKGMDCLYAAEQEQPGSLSQTKLVGTGLSYFLEALNYDDTNLAVLSGIYRCHIRSGEPLKAKKTLERIKEIDPKFDIYSIFKDKSEITNKSSDCFVATRVFGEMHPETVFLRAFRDQVLKNYFAGRVFIRWYYRVGPALAELPGRSPIYKIIEKFVYRLNGLIRRMWRP